MENEQSRGSPGLELRTTVLQHSQDGVCECVCACDDDIIRVLVLASVIGPFPPAARNTQVEPDTRSQGFSRKTRGPVLGTPRGWNHCKCHKWMKGLNPKRNLIQSALGSAVWSVSHSISEGQHNRHYSIPLWWHYQNYLHMKAIWLRAARVCLCVCAFWTFSLHFPTSSSDWSAAKH